MSAPTEACTSTIHVPVVPTAQATLEARTGARATDQVAARPDRNPGHRVTGRPGVTVTSVANEGRIVAEGVGAVASADPVGVIPTPVELGVGLQVHPPIVDAYQAGLVVARAVVAPSKDARQEETARFPFAGGAWRQP